MHAVFLSPVSWEWDTNVTAFSVVFAHKLLSHAEKNSVKIEEKNQFEKKEKRAKQNDKIKKNIRSCFR